MHIAKLISESYWIKPNFDFPNDLTRNRFLFGIKPIGNYNPNLVTFNKIQKRFIYQSFYFTRSIFYEDLKKTHHQRNAEEWLLILYTWHERGGQDARVLVLRRAGGNWGALPREAAYIGRAGVGITISPWKMLHRLSELLQQLSA